MRRSFVVVFVAGTSLAGTACSLTTSLEGLSSTVIVVEANADASGATDGTASTDDGSTRADAIADAGDAAGAPNLHPRGTFETGTCGSWVGFQGTVAQDSNARTGSGSCLVCTGPMTTDYFTADDNGAPGPAVVGATYRAEGWVRSAPGKPNAGPVRLFLRNFTVVGGTFRGLESSASASSEVDAQWRSRATTLTVTKDGGKLNVFVSADHRSGACFLLDDVTVRRID